MATDDLGALNDPRVRDFVAVARVAHLATATPDGVPHNIPLCFWFDGAHFYFAIDEKPKRGAGRELKRMRNIAANPRVALIIDHYEEDWTSLAYVLVHGRAAVVEDHEEYMLALRNLRHKYRQYQVMALNPDNNPLVRIEPERIHVWGARFNPGGSRP